MSAISKYQKQFKRLVILFVLEFFSTYHVQFIAPILAFCVVVYSYYLLLTLNNFAPAIMLILSSRVINGVILPGVSGSYRVMTILTYYLPTFIFIARNLRIKIKLQRKTFKEYKWPMLFTTFYTILFIINIQRASSLFLTSILPILLFVSCVVLIPREAYEETLEPIVFYLRSIFICSLVLYVLPGYKSVTTALVQSGKPFGVPADTKGAYEFLGIFRNSGIFFDCRILGIFAYIYLYIVGQIKERVSALDILLSGVIVISTFSRGGIVGYLFVLLGYLIVINNTWAKYALWGIGGLSLVVVVLFVLPMLDDTTKSFLSTFDLREKYNALSQRSVFKDFAIDLFRKHPIIGGGIGSLTARDGSRVIFRDLDVAITVVTDAYLFSLLGETGLIGAGFFLTQFYKLCRGCSQKRILSVSLFLGMVVHMLGTDIPNMRLFYFCVLMLICLANWNSRLLFKAE